MYNLEIWRLRSVRFIHVYISLGKNELQFPRCRPPPPHRFFFFLWSTVIGRALGVIRANN